MVVCNMYELVVIIDFCFLSRSLFVKQVYMINWNNYMVMTLSYVLCNFLFVLLYDGND